MHGRYSRPLAAFGALTAAALLTCLVAQPSNTSLLLGVSNAPVDDHHPLKTGLTTVKMPSGGLGDIKAIKVDVSCPSGSCAPSPAPARPPPPRESKADKAALRRLRSKTKTLDDETNRLNRNTVQLLKKGFPKPAAAPAPKCVNCAPPPAPPPPPPPPPPPRKARPIIVRIVNPEPPQGAKLALLRRLLARIGKKINRKFRDSVGAMRQRVHEKLRRMTSALKRLTKVKMCKGCKVKAGGGRLRLILALMREQRAEARRQREDIGRLRRRIRELEKRKPKRGPRGLPGPPGKINIGKLHKWRCLRNLSRQVAHASKNYRENQKLGTQLSKELDKLRREIKLGVQ